VPTANSAVQTHVQPSKNPSGRLRRLALKAVGVVVGISLLVPAAAALPTTVAAATGCSGWNSTTRPPDRIRVLRVRTGRIETVDFRKYVVTVMGKEWPSYLPQAVVEAGAVAVKQYAWYHSMNPRRTKSGRCFDVRDSTGDQLYKPARARIRSDHHRAIDTTWGIHLEKDGRLFMTGYRRGNKGPCGSDATGWKLFARTATRCANNGKGFREILRIYYRPVAIVGGGGSGSSVSSALAQSSSSADAQPSGSGAGTGQVAPADPDTSTSSSTQPAAETYVVAVTAAQLATISTAEWRDLFSDQP
jgi:hypothetical protein